MSLFPSLKPECSSSTNHTRKDFFFYCDDCGAPLTPARLIPGRRSLSQSQFDLSQALAALPQKYDAPIPLNAGQLASLKQLLAFIDTENYPYIKEQLSH